MSRLEPKNVLILLLLGLFLWAAAEGPVRGSDGGGGDHDRGLIAVTGSYGSGASALYLVDTRTRHMAVYRLENGRELEFVAARDCAYDFYLETYNDRSAPGYLPGNLRRSWERHGRRLSQGIEEEQGAEDPPEGAERPVGPRVRRIGRGPAGTARGKKDEGGSREDGGR